MKYTLKQFKELKPSEQGLQLFKQIGSTDLHTILLTVNKTHSHYSRWIFTSLMTRKQFIEVSIYAAKLVLPIFEKKYPNDNRPRLSIEAAIKVLKCNSKTNRNAARLAADGAKEAAKTIWSTADDIIDDTWIGSCFATDVGTAYAAIDAAAYAARSASYSAAAAVADISLSSAAYASLSADAAASIVERIKIEEKIILYAVKLLEKKEISY